LETKAMSIGQFDCPLLVAFLFVLGIAKAVLESC
jgi:hypothetical protein